MSSLPSTPAADPSAAGGPLPRRRARGARPRRRQVAAGGLLVVGLLAGGCTSGLSGSQAEKESERQGTTTGELTAWPGPEAQGEAMSPAWSDLTVSVDQVIRDGADDTTTVLLRVRNDSTDGISMVSAFGGNLADLAVVDPTTGDRWAPMQAEDANRCVCSTNTTFAAGETTTLYATFEGLPADLDALRVDVPSFRPIDDVAITTADALAVEPKSTMPLEANDDLRFDIEGVWRTDEGTLVRLSQRNLGDDPANLVLDYPSPDLLAAVDTSSGATSLVAKAGSESLVTEPSPEDSNEIERDESRRRDVLLAPLPERTESVTLTLAQARRSLPVAVQDEGAPSSPVLDEIVSSSPTASLASPRSKGAGKVIAIGDPSQLDVDETGTEITLPDAGAALTSDAQPGWEITPRAVVRLSDEQSVLYVDLARNGASDSFPEGLGAEEYQTDLSGVGLIDTDGKRRYGPLVGTTGEFGSFDVPTIGDGDTRTAHQRYGALPEDLQRITVDVPGFGRAAVPVTTVADAHDDAPLATMRVDTNERLRMDVLAVDRLPRDAGTLVRVRLVNESHPDAVAPPFAGEGSSPAMCETTLMDPTSNRQFDTLSPCVSTDWSRDLGAGDSLVYEVRFPDLPDDVEAVTVDAPGWLGTVPIPVGDSGSPWYLDLPRRAEAPSGDTGEASAGVADDLQTEVRSGDTVDLRLNTDVLFDFGQATLTPEARTALTQIGERLADQASGAVTVTGHTDNVGSDAANQDLSMRRAQAVEAVLAAAAGPGISFNVEGRGETEPVAPNEIGGRDNPDGRSRNRRVAISYTAS